MNLKKSFCIEDSHDSLKITPTSIVKEEDINECYKNYNNLDVRNYYSNDNKNENPPKAKSNKYPTIFDSPQNLANDDFMKSNNKIFKSKNRKANYVITINSDVDKIGSEY